MRKQEIDKIVFRMNQNIGLMLCDDKFGERLNYDILQCEYCLALYNGTDSLIENKLNINKNEYDIFEILFTEYCTDWRMDFDYLGELRLLVDNKKKDWLFETI